MDVSMVITLEHIVTQKEEVFDRPVYEFVSQCCEQLHIASYVVGGLVEAKEIPGEPVLGLERKQPGLSQNASFNLWRWKTEIRMETDDDDHVEIVRRMFRIDWFEPDGNRIEGSACYPVLREILRNEKLEVDPPTGDWLFLLKREKTASGDDLYHFCYLFPETGPGGSPGGKEGYMKATNTDCASPSKFFEKLRCRLLKK